MFYVRYSFCKLAYPSMFLSCVVFLSFVMITYSVGAKVVAGLEAPLEDEETWVNLVIPWVDSMATLL